MIHLQRNIACFLLLAASSLSASLNSQTVVPTSSDPANLTAPGSQLPGQEREVAPRVTAKIDEKKRTMLSGHVRPFLHLTKA